MGWWQPLDTQSPIQGARKQLHLHVIYMLFHYGWKPPIVFGPSPLPHPLQVSLSVPLLPPTQRSPSAGWSRDQGRAVTHLPRDPISPFAWGGDCRGGPGGGQGGGPCVESQADCESGGVAESCGSLGGEGRGGAGGRKGVGTRALAKAGSFDKETGSRGRGDPECPGGRLCRGGTTEAERWGRPDSLDRAQRGDEQGRRAEAPGPSPSSTLHQLCGLGVLRLSGLSFLICKVGWCRGISEIVYVRHLPTEAQQPLPY